jgi:ABC-type glycerol-3-phosphate transport system substrate-binding protein
LERVSACASTRALGAGALAAAALGAGIAAAGAGCRREPRAPAAIRFLHTFGPEETELLNAALAERGLAVEASLVPFARGQQVIGELLRVGVDCPDLIRIDATWLRAFVAADQLVPVPPELAGLDWTPEAAALAGEHAVPQTVDGLMVVRPRARPAPASPALADVVAAARAAIAPGAPHPLGVRVDGYWFLPWLRAEGGELAVTGMDGEGALAALRAYAALFGDVSPRPPPAGSEQPEELRRWRAGELAYWITGPWQIGALPDRDRVEVSPLAHAPRGGQLLAVPRCARDPAGGWRLARELTEAGVALQLAAGLATVPTRRAVLARAPALVQAEYRALAASLPLPPDPRTPLLFDDLNPALAAVVARDATPEEALGGVRRAWHRIGGSARADPPAPPAAPGPGRAEAAPRVGSAVGRDPR